jgi:hypothetical protein
MGKLNKGYHCWLTNITKYKIVLGDLKFTLQPRQTIDILDDKHSNYTVEEVQKSISSGSISKKLNKSIYVRTSKPEPKRERKIKISEISYPYKSRSIVEVEEPNYDELEIEFSDEEYAEENANLAGNEKELFIGGANKEDIEK